MNIKFLKDRYGFKAGETHKIDEAEAKAFIASGHAQEVSGEDVLDQAFAAFTKNVNESIEAKMTEVTASLTQKLARGVQVSRPTIVVGPDRELEDTTGGYKSFGEFCKDVVSMNPKCGGRTSEKMSKYMTLAAKGAASLANTEGAAPDAGPTVPVQYTSDIFSITGDVPNFMDLAFQVPMQSAYVKIPVLKNYNRSNVTAANGVVAAVVAEGTAISPSKTNWEQISLTLAKEAVLVPVSNELLEDNIVALDGVISKQASYQITKAVNRGILQGSSALTGIIGHACVKAVSRANSGIVQFGDVMNMYASFNHDDSNYGGAVWFMHPTVLPQLATMTSGNYNIYLPPGGAQDGSFGRLLGRPVIVTGQAGALGDNDLILADMKKYIIGYRGGLKAASSIHLYFDADEVAFRFTLRLNGKPGLSGPITLEDGSTIVSPFCVLVGTTGS